MKLTLNRKFYGAKFTEGEILIDGKFECYTVEDTDRKLETAGESAKIEGVTAIPKGTYEVTISMSKRFGKFLIEIMGVPYFKGVRIHSGNSSNDSEGCIIVGKSNNRNDDNWVSESRVAYDALHKKVKEVLSAGEKVTLEVL